MKNLLKKLPSEMQELIFLAGNIAFSKKMSVYLIGGFVRDLILGVKNLDLDIAVEGDGILFAEELAGRLNAAVVRHKRFGTAVITPGHHLKIDVATARKETYSQPAVLPLVEFGSLRDDLRRRDFTINAMAVNITAGEYFGELLDFFHGRKDLSSGQVRILHDLSFVDDPTRILRAVRFEKRYDFRLEKQTLKHLKEAVRKKMLEKVQPQRLREEMILILKEEDPVKQLKRIKQLSGFGFMNPRLSFSRDTQNLLNRVGKEINWFEKLHSSRRKLDKWLIYFMALIDSLNIKDTRLLCAKFVFRKGEEKRIFSVKQISPASIRSLSSDNIKPSRIFSLLQPLSYEAVIFMKAKYKNRVFRKHIEDFLEIYTDMRVHTSGDELHGMGLPPGPHYQRIFSKVLKAKLDGRIKSKEQEIELIEKLIKQ